LLAMLERRPTEDDEERNDVERLWPYAETALSYVVPRETTAQQLMARLPAATDERNQRALLRALGKLAYLPAQPLFETYTDNDDARLKYAAVEALVLMSQAHPETVERTREVLERMRVAGTSP